ncbi:hypothetical protein ACWGCW_33090 [Streptomyces sp. NPDC054933]
MAAASRRSGHENITRKTRKTRKTAKDAGKPSLPSGMIDVPASYAALWLPRKPLPVAIDRRPP